MSGSYRYLCKSGIGAALASVSFLCFGQQERVKNDEAPTSSKLEGMAPINPIRIFRPNPYLEIAFDTRTRNPVYVIECLATDTNNADSEKNPRLKRPHFYEEKSLPEEFRSRPGHYKNSGYDRGHLAAAGNYTDKTMEMLTQTFNLCNVSPQEHTMNFKVWAALEKWSRKVSKDHAGDGTTYVVSGPLWMPSQRINDKLFAFHYNAIGTPPSLVSVPTHLFKVVVVVNHKSGLISHLACFVVPNETPKSDYHLEDYLVPWKNLEAVTGLHFFPSLVNKNDPGGWKQIADAVSDQVLKDTSQKNRMLLLQDGSPSNSRSLVPLKKQKWFQAKSRGQVRHLCAGGNCRR